ncbi:hypothetical protein D3C75_1044360 [compost metagenome]
MVEIVHYAGVHIAGIADGIRRIVLNERRYAGPDQDTVPVDLLHIVATDHDVLECVEFMCPCAIRERVRHCLNARIRYVDDSVVLEQNVVPCALNGRICASGMEINSSRTAISAENIMDVEVLDVDMHEVSGAGSFTHHKDAVPSHVCRLLAARNL